MLASVSQTTTEVAVLMQQRGGEEAAAGGGVTLFIYLIFLVGTIAGLWKVFAKAGEPGWAAIVPIYNLIVWCKIVGRPMWWIILMFVPIVSLVIAIILMNDLSKSFGRGVGFTVGLILLPFIFLPMLGFGSDQYRGPANAAAPMARPI